MASNAENVSIWWRHHVDENPPVIGGFAYQRVSNSGHLCLPFQREQAFEQRIALPVIQYAFAFVWPHSELRFYLIMDLFVASWYTDLP